MGVDAFQASSFASKDNLNWTCACLGEETDARRQPQFGVVVFGLLMTQGHLQQLARPLSLEAWVERRKPASLASHGISSKKEFVVRFVLLSSGLSSRFLLLEGAPQLFFFGRAAKVLFRAAS